MEHLAADVRAEAVGEVAAGVQRHAEHPLVAELVAQRLPVLLGELVDVLGAACFSSAGDSTRWARIDQNATRLASMPECGWA